MLVLATLASPVSARPAAVAAELAPVVPDAAPAAAQTASRKWQLELLHSHGGCTDDCGEDFDTGLGLVTSLGYRPLPHLAVALDLSLRPSEEDNDDEGWMFDDDDGVEHSAMEFQFGPSLRIYPLGRQSMLEAYLLGGFYWSDLSSDTEYGRGKAPRSQSSKKSYSILGYGPAAGAGAQLFLLPWMALNVRYVYSFVFWQEACTSVEHLSREQETCTTRDDLANEDKRPNLYSFSLGVTFAF